MKGVFTLSLDCEGKWGVADSLEGRNALITKEALDFAYKYICDTLSANDIRASFAFTSLFSVEEDRIISYFENFSSYCNQGYDWFRPICAMMKTGKLEGWVGKSYFDRAINEGHEISWHGFSHHSLADVVSKELVIYEAQEGRRICQENRVEVCSMVFPRNAVGHIELLRSFGFEVYRDGGAAGWASSKYFRLLDEFNFMKKSSRLRGDGFVLPSGNFLNWPAGFRSIVPRDLTVRRWKGMLDDAVNCGGEVHLWFHPHNLITAPSMMEVFREVIEYVGKLVKTGGLCVKTMGELSGLHKEGV